MTESALLELNIEDPGDLAPHPLATMWPALTEDRKAALRNDIAEQGLLDPITLIRADNGADWLILDGRHRYEACHQTSQPVHFEEYVGGDAARLSISKNANRRHFEDNQLLVRAVLEHVEWKERGQAGGQGAEGSITTEEVAQMIGVSISTVKRVKKLIRIERGELEPEQRRGPKPRELDEDEPTTEKNEVTEDDSETKLVPIGRFEEVQERAVAAEQRAKSLELQLEAATIAEQGEEAVAEHVASVENSRNRQMDENAELKGQVVTADKARQYAQRELDEVREKLSVAEAEASTARADANATRGWIRELAARYDRLDKDALHEWIGEQLREGGLA